LVFELENKFIKKISLKTTGKPNLINRGDPIVVEIDIENAEHSEALLTLAIVRTDNTYVSGFNTRGSEIQTLPTGKFRVRATIAPDQLGKAKYGIECALRDPVSKKILDFKRYEKPIHIADQVSGRDGIANLKVGWEKVE